MSEPTKGSAEGQQSNEQSQITSQLPNGYFLQIGTAAEEVSLLSLWEAIISRKKLITIIVAGFTILGVLLALVLPRQYSAESIIAEANAASQSQSTGGTDEIPDLSVSVSVDEAVALMESRALLYDFIEKNKIMPVLFDSKWDEENNKWEDGVDVPTAWEGYDKFVSDILDISQDTETNLITVSTKWTDPELSAKWTNNLVDHINALLQQRAIEESEKIIKELNARLEKTTVLDLQQALYDLMEVQMGKIVSARVHPEYAFKVLDRALVPEEQAIPYFQLIIIGVMFFLGLVFALALALFLNTLSKGLKEREIT